MAPNNSDYDCQYWENGQLVGQLKWNHTNHRMDIKGTIFIDGNFRFDEDGEIIHYYGRANIMSSRDDEIDAVVCAGGAADASGNPTGNTYATSCYVEHVELGPDAEHDGAHVRDAERVRPGRHDRAAALRPTCYNGHLPPGSRGSCTRPPTA